MFLNQKMTLKLFKPHIMRYHNVENFVFFYMTPKSCQDDFLFSCYALFCETMIFSYCVAMETALELVPTTKPKNNKWILNGGCPT